MTIPTMQEIDRAKEVLTRYNLPHDMPYIETLYTAARRGVEADAEIARLNLLNDGHQRLATQYRERAEKAEADAQACREQIDDMLKEIMATRAELAALKAAQPQEYPSSADDEATRWRHGEKI